MLRRSFLASLSTAPLFSFFPKSSKQTIVVYCLASSEYTNHWNLIMKVADKHKLGILKGVTVSGTVIENGPDSEWIFERGTIATYLV